MIWFCELKVLINPKWAWLEIRDSKKFSAANTTGAELSFTRAHYGQF